MAKTLESPRRQRSVVAGTVGNLVEWFDWSLYAFMTPFLAQQFFADLGPAAATLSAFGVYAVGFFFRPLGGAVLGSYADRHGRRAGMTLTILLMAGASLAIALIPSAATIGVAAPILLVIARCVQGFSAGGEFGTSSAFMVENAGPGRRAFIGSFQQVSVGGGTALAALLTAAMMNLMSPEAITSWGWRAAFVFAAVLGVMGLYIRLRVDETPPFQAVVDGDHVERRPVWQVLRTQPRAILRVLGMLAAGTGLAQLWLVAYPTFAKDYVGAPLKLGQQGALVALIVFTVLVIPMGWLSDRVGRKPVLIGFSIAAGLAFPIVMAIMRPNPVGVILPAVIMGAILAAYAGCLAAVMAEQFPTALRTAGISVAYGLAVAIFGGLTPIIATALIKQMMAPVLVAYVVFLCMISLFTYFLMPETHQRDLNSIRGQVRDPDPQ